MCGDEMYQVEPGGFVYLPRGIPHTFSVVGDTPARFLALYSPGGIEKFFAELGVPANSLHPEPQAELDIDRVVRVAAKYGVTLVSPEEAP